MIPGSNLLDDAFLLINTQRVSYFQFLSRSVNQIGYDVAVYASPVYLNGSLQPVPRNLYEKYGLDFQKSYLTFYASANILDVKRDVSGDQIVFNGKKYQVESSNDWFLIDGWVGVLIVYIGAA